MKPTELAKIIKEEIVKAKQLKSKQPIKESITDKLSDIKNQDKNNEISKIKGLMAMKADEGKAYAGLAKEARKAFKEYDYDKLEAEAKRYDQLAETCATEYNKLKDRLTKLEAEKKAAKGGNKSAETKSSEKKDDKKEKKELKENIEEARTNPLIKDLHLVNADYSDFGGFVNQLKPVLKKLGLYVINDPILDGSDSIGIIISKTPITKSQIQILRKEYFGPDEEDLDENTDNTRRKVEDIFFKWDEIVDNDRQGIEQGYTNGEPVVNIYMNDKSIINKKGLVDKFLNWLIYKTQGVKLAKSNNIITITFPKKLNESKKVILRLKK